MRNYMRKKQNPTYLPHDIYMQMLYLIRDYHANGQKNKDSVGGLRARQWKIAAEILQQEEQAYSGNRKEQEHFDALQAFFDYPYFSMMFTQKSRDAGASKRSWALYRSRLAYAIAEKLELLPESANHQTV